MRASARPPLLGSDRIGSSASSLNARNISGRADILMPIFDDDLERRPLGQTGTLDEPRDQRDRSAEADAVL